MPATTADLIAVVCDEVKDILVRKNLAYGDSATNPVRVFSRADTREQLLVRLDDKLSRVARGHELGEDVVLDLIGYLVLLRVHDRQADSIHDAAFEAEKDDMLGRIHVEQVRPPGRDLRRSED